MYEVKSNHACTMITLWLLYIISYFYLGIEQELCIMNDYWMIIRYY